MTPDDFDTFGDMLTSISEMYGKKLSPQTITMYFTSLQNYPLKSVAIAFNLHVRNPDNGQFMPKPADVVRMIDGETNTQGMSAWTKVLDAIKTVGSYRSVAFDDPIIHRVIQDMGGWTKLCECKEAETPFVAKEFEKRYQGYAIRKSALGADYPKVLLGHSDADNMCRGYLGNNMAVSVIGNPERASLTMKGGQPIGGSSQGKSVANLSLEALGGNQIYRGRIPKALTTAPVKHEDADSRAEADCCINYEAGETF